MPVRVERVRVWPVGVEDLCELRDGEELGEVLGSEADTRPMAPDGGFLGAADMAGGFLLRSIRYLSLGRTVWLKRMVNNGSERKLAVGWQLCTVLLRFNYSLYCLQRIRFGGYCPRRNRRTNGQRVRAWGCDMMAVPYLHLTFYPQIMYYY